MDNSGFAGGMGISFGADGHSVVTGTPEAAVVPKKVIVQAGEVLPPAKVRAKVDEMRRNVSAAVGRKWPEHPPMQRHAGTMILVGGGPSLPSTVGALRRLVNRPKHYTWALNMSAGWLEQRKFPVNYACLLDPKVWVKDYIKPNTETVYFIASQTHPETQQVFDKPEIKKFLWHAEDTEIMDLLSPEQAKRSMPQVGSTVGLRSLIFNYYLGFRFFHLFGYDSSYGPKDELHGYDKPHEIRDRHTVYPRPFDGAEVNEFEETALEGLQEFVTSGHMLRQAEEFNRLMREWTLAVAGGHIDPIKITVHGTGLLPTIAGFHEDFNKKHGLPVIVETAKGD